MPVKRRRPKLRTLPLAPWKVDFLLTGLLPEDDTPGFNRYEGLNWQYHNPRKRVDPARIAWEENREVLIKEWSKKHPGHRPYAWWRYDAQEPRRRIGGKGTPLSEVFAAMSDTYEFGVITDWLTESWAGIKTSGDFEPYDPDDPPAFESEPEYLARLGLLTAEESKALGHSPT